MEPIKTLGRPRWLGVVAATVLIAGLFIQPALADGKRSAKKVARLSDSALGPVLAFNYSLITINDSAAATPYPAVAPLNWCAGTITDVNLGLYNFGHTFPDDVDIVLQGPGGQSAKVMSDVGGSTPVEDFFLFFDDEAATPAPDAGPLVDGTTYQPNNPGGATDGMPAPSPDPTSAVLSMFDGASANGNWNLFVRDDAGGDIGDLELGFDLEITVTSQQSGSRVCIPHFGPGEPYPSQQTISGRSTPIQDVNVTLSGLSHTFPDDIDALLQGPAGQNVMLMSDAGADGDINNVNLTFDDEAAAGLPDNAQIVSGSFRPTNFGTETMPVPAPAGPHGTSLTAFDGTNPNGVWRLFVSDDVGGDQGILNSWTLNITTPAGTIAVKGGKVKEGKTRTFTLTRTINTSVSETVSYATKNGSAKAGKDYKKVSGTTTFAAGETTKTVKVKTKDDNLDERTEKFFLTATAGGVTTQGAARIKDND